MDWGRQPVAAQPQAQPSTSYTRFCIPTSLWAAPTPEKPKSRGCVDSLYAFAGFQSSQESFVKEEQPAGPAPAPATPPQSELGTDSSLPLQEAPVEDDDYGWEAETSAAAARRAEKKRLTKAKEAAVRCFGNIRPSCTRPAASPVPQQEPPRSGQPYGKQQQQQYAQDGSAPIVVYR